MSLALPGHLLFFFIIYYVESKHVIPLTGWLVIFYLIISFMQVVILFLVCYWLVIKVWKMKRNPDNDAIPLLTALGDLIGILLLYACFLLLGSLGVDRYDKHGTSTNSTIAPLTVEWFS